MVEHPYQERYCAFVDILGFSALVGGLRDGTVQFETIRNLLRQIYTPQGPLNVGLGPTDFRAQSISDGVALSTRRNPIGLTVLCATLSELSLALLHEGYFTRGAVCKGLLYHDDSMVFGEALIRAYRLEQEVVKYPRIMVTKDVVEDAMASELREDFSQQIKQAEDGPYFIHVLWRLRMLLDMIQKHPMDEQYPEPDFSYFATIREMIQRRFSESVDTPKHFEKVQWFARYWNNSIIRIRTSVDRISGPGLDDKQA
jgi:hypothetical protein